uniref:Large ribosomal subunit protein uL18c n=1 Tax=Pyropia perforata TaxID=182771 RepID=A0A023I7D5_PYRPE|nr:50S ribosomal protein L18 [Neoporphyra perforata]AGV01100.1 50S ribosomal protein L18 [Neoporphyra perforata]AHB35075.1 50S ribosomal protein L18 [Neoporphyra perforata]AHB35284.1 50S ribosomal protein L18 [Neoporphyra perforata]AIA19446.1 50S ribosomal protein L18 [Neoporphyra perforata]AIA19655.1 50S ribosomal protein L18 [Neoporphyra perforata]
MKINTKQTRIHKHKRVRKKVQGTSTKPRLCVFRSNKHIYAQIIDDMQGTTLVATSSLNLNNQEFDKIGPNCDTSRIVGKQLAEKSINEGIINVVFDRGGKLYHGRVKALAEAAKAAGMGF